jgi:hypothetical protein
MTDEELAEQRRAKDRERKRRYRERQREGGATRTQWLAAHSISRDKPWLLLGISRASYYRKLAKDKVRQVASAMKLKQHRTQPVSPSKRHVSRAVQATSTPRLNINRKGRSNRTAESVATDATNRPRVLRTQPVSPSDGIAGSMICQFPRSCGGPPYRKRPNDSATAAHDFGVRRQPRLRRLFA